MSLSDGAMYALFLVVATVSLTLCGCGSSDNGGSSPTTPSIPTVKLSNGVQMPVIAAGVWKYNDTQTVTSVQLALKVGYTHIDTAYDYKNQKAVSKGLQAAGVARDKVFITTKVPGCGIQGVNGSRCKDDTLKMIKEDVADLNSAYKVGKIDLILVHFPPCPADDGSSDSPMKSSCFAKKTGCAPDHCQAVQDQWSVMEQAYSEGLTRAIGVSNYCAACFDCLSSVKVQPMVNQVQYHLGMGPDPQGFKSFAKKKGIVLQAWSPLGSGADDILHSNLTTSIGTEHGKSSVQVALKWIQAQGVSMITKSLSEDHLRDNLDIFDWELSADELSQLNAANFSTNTPSFLCDSQAGQPDNIVFA